MGLEQSKIVFEVTVTVAPVPKGKVFSVGNVVQALKNSVKNRLKGIKNEKRKFWDFIKERADSKRIPVGQLLEEPYFKRLKETEEKKWRNERRALEPDPDGTTKYGRGVADSEMSRERYLRICYYPLFGSEKDGVKGLIPLGRMALTGDRHLKKYLKPGLDEIITGAPVCICPQGQLKEFKKVVSHQIHESGRIIIEGGLTENDINAQTVQLNRLINLYCSPDPPDGPACAEPACQSGKASAGRRAGIEPFSPGGISHCDFIVRELPDPDNPGATLKLLALDIKVSEKD